jgi:hypothetical protein
LGVGGGIVLLCYCLLRWLTFSSYTLYLYTLYPLPYTLYPNPTHLSTYLPICISTYLKDNDREFLEVRPAGFNAISYYNKDGSYAGTENVASWERYALNYWWEQHRLYASCPQVGDPCSMHHCISPMYVCMYVYVCMSYVLCPKQTLIYSYNTHTHTYTYIHTYIHTHIHIHIYIYTHIHTHTHTHTRTHTHTYTHTYTHTHTHT